MGRGEYVSYVGINGTSNTAPPPPMQPRALDAPAPANPPLSQPSDPMPMPRPSRTAPWTEAQKQAFTRTYGLSAIGSVAGAVLWKEHRVWGFILGGMAGGGVGKVIFAPRDPLYDLLDKYR